MYVCTSLFVTFAFVGCLATDMCPQIVERFQWGARRPKSTRALSVIPAPYVVIHHSDGNNCTTSEQCKRIVRNIQNYHMNVRNWEDIGYNFLVGGDGKVYEGRGHDIHGAHCVDYNSRSLGVCLLGSYEDKLPSEKQLDAAKDAIECFAKHGFLAKDYKIIGHRQGSKTACPGDKLYEEIQSWRNFEPYPS